MGQVLRQEDNLCNIGLLDALAYLQCSEEVSSEVCVVLRPLIAQVFKEDFRICCANDAASEEDEKSDDHGEKEGENEEDEDAENATTSAAPIRIESPEQYLIRRFLGAEALAAHKDNLAAYILEEVGKGEEGKGKEEDAAAAADIAFLYEREWLSRLQDSLPRLRRSLLTFFMDELAPRMLLKTRCNRLLREVNVPNLSLRPLTLADSVERPPPGSGMYGDTPYVPPQIDVFGSPSSRGYGAASVRLALFSGEKPSRDVRELAAVLRALREFDGGFLDLAVSHGGLDHVFKQFTAKDS